MRLDVSAFRSFYKSPLGQMTQRLLSNAISNHLPERPGLEIMGLGFATPYLRHHLGTATRVLSFMPAAQGVTHWPGEGPYLSTLIDDAELPLPDQSMDIILAVHSFEMTDSLGYSLQEIWRVLKANGRLIAIVPNRRGLWVRFDNTPFGHGRPFSRSQLTGILQDTLLTPEAWSEALFVPPVAARPIMRSAAVIDRVGRSTIGVMSGALVVEASKKLFQRAVAKETRRIVPRIGPILVPAPRPVASFEPQMSSPCAGQTSPDRQRG